MTCCQCKARFRTLPDEEGDHACPKCGYHPSNGPMWCPCCGNEVIGGHRCPACHSPLVTQAPPAFLPADFGEPAMHEEDDGRREDWVIHPEDFDRCP